MVIKATSARQALEIIEQEKVHLVVTDHVMPGMTGLQLVETVGKSRPELPSILATGYGELSSEGARPFVKLDKPFMQAELAEAVSRALPAE